MHCKARHDKVQHYGRQKSMYHKKKNLQNTSLSSTSLIQKLCVLRTSINSIATSTYIWIKAEPIYNSNSKIFYKSLA